MTDNTLEILTYAAQRGASDIHLSPSLPPHLRIDGELCVLSDIDFGEKDMQSLLNDIQISGGFYSSYSTEEMNERDGTLVIDNSGTSLRFRVNIFKENGSYAIALRIIPERIKSIDDLGLPYTLKEIAKAKHGLFFVTGTAGSGKSTTLAAIINEINKNRAAHIITIEDPIEYIFTSAKSLIHQREIGRDTESFECALKSVVRQDPDVIMIGEMRDKTTARAALHAAETGHLVLTTLHTESAAGSIERFFGFFGAGQREISSQLASVLIGVLSQKLVRKKNGGRTALCEYLHATDAVRSNIRECQCQMLENAIQTGASFGMVSYDVWLRKLLESGVITEETFRENSRKKHFAAYCG